MNKQDIKQGMEELAVYATVKEIEKAIGMPNTTIQQVLTGGRLLPGKWVKPLRKYFLENKDKGLAPVQVVEKKSTPAPSRKPFMSDAIRKKLGR